MVENIIVIQISKIIVKYNILNWSIDSFLGASVAIKMGK